MVWKDKFGWRKSKAGKKHISGLILILSPYLRQLPVPQFSLFVKCVVIHMCIFFLPVTSKCLRGMYYLIYSLTGHRQIVLCLFYKMAKLRIGKVKEASHSGESAMKTWKNMSFGSCCFIPSVLDYITFWNFMWFLWLMN